MYRISSMKNKNNFPRKVIFCIYTYIPKTQPERIYNLHESMEQVSSSIPNGFTNSS